MIENSEERLLDKHVYSDWQPGFLHEGATWTLSDIPQHELVVTSFVLAFIDHQELLMTRHRTRGLDIPGGHLEANESPCAAAKRELFEETGGVVTHLHLIAGERVIAEELSSRLRSEPTWQLFYVGRVSSMCDRVSGKDVLGRAIVPVTEAPILVNWVRHHPEIYKAAIGELAGSADAHCQVPDETI